MIKAGEFVSQLHIGSLMLAELYGFIDLPRRKPPLVCAQSAELPELERSPLPASPSQSRAMRSSERVRAAQAG